MKLEDLIIKILRKEVVPAIGCTEPVAVALACAKAKELINESGITAMEVFVSPNIYKNGLAVGVPPTDEVGLYIAAALGYIGGKSEKGLQVLEDIKKEEIDLAKELVKSGKVLLNIQDTTEKVYIETRLHSENSTAKVIIKGRHDQFVYLENQGQVMEERLDESREILETENLLYHIKIRKIIEAIEKIPYSSIAFMLDGLAMNEKVAMAGLQEKVGMGVGYSFLQNIRKGILCDDLMNHAKMLTAAASDVRMSGLKIPVMSSNGSGNNGLTAILPIAAYRRKFDVSDERLARALAMSHIINSYIKNYIGRLSVLCGCGVAAGTGAGVAIAWLMGGTIHQIEGVIKNILGDISGMICDGAKVGCALKLSTSTSSAIQAALLAIDNYVIPAGNGIIAETVEDTIKNLKVLSSEGMTRTDAVILNVMRRQ
ncbi:MAG: L-serine ammonia-lyase, iron-sulfur-dependent, subunit alpha [Thermotaleaceae bacterium]